MDYSSAQRSFKANGSIAPSSPDAKTNIALNELTASLATDIQNLRSQVTALRLELENLKAEKRRLII